MKELVVWVEIPVSDFQRAVNFYDLVLKINIAAEQMGKDLMGFFQLEGYGSSGAIIKGEDYHPGNIGPLVYLSLEDDIKVVLNRVVEAGGKIIKPKTLVSAAIGYIGVFEDSEGNRIALHSK